MQTLRKKTSPCKYKNEPSRFLGEGVSFKAKLIGILEVSEARGDRMCQEALADLKMAIRAAGEHKQRITINIAIDGLRLRDEKTGDSLYHHPVHKISFIAQDMSDSRAFGYIFGSPDTGHRFFGIKTDKAASQVVIAMRDLFQVVFELKKKEIELAKQHIEQKSRFSTNTSATLFSDSAISSSSNTKSYQNGDSHASSKLTSVNESSSSKVAAASTEGAAAPRPESAIADLVDLELELSSIQQGIHQMERITPSDPFGPNTDPFGDSFTSFPQKPFLPPPPPSARDRPSRNASSSDTSSMFSPKTPKTGGGADEQNTLFKTSHDEPTSCGWFTPTGGNDSLFEDALSLPSESSVTVTAADVSTAEDIKETNASILSQFDVFTELDPLGTGRSKPYIDKKLFFQELKNPPKKVLKDLVTETQPSEASSLFTANFQTTTTTNTTTVFQNDPFADDDPFDKTDPFAEDDFVTKTTTDPFDTEFVGDFKILNNNETDTKFKFPSLQPLFPSTLSKSPNRFDKQISLNNNNMNISPRATFDVKFDADADKKFTRLDQLHENPSLDMSSESECAPEPPPRPATSSISAMKPPPLPPKKQAGDLAVKPPPRPPHTEESHYDYMDNYESGSLEGPPLPVPARKSHLDGGAPQRPNKKQILQGQSSEDDYLQPIPPLSQKNSRNTPPILVPPPIQVPPPILLPPPMKRDHKRHQNNHVTVASYLESKPKLTSTTATTTVTDKLNLTADTLDITLSQLTLSGLNELATKLNIPASQLSNMTLVQLTSYLSNYVKTSTSSNDATFPTFKADFSNFDSSKSTKSEPYDRYAVFRELLQQENNKNEQETKTSPTQTTTTTNICSEQPLKDTNEFKPVFENTSNKTDRYAALRDIVIEDIVIEDAVISEVKETNLLEETSPVKQPEEEEEEEEEKLQNDLNLESLKIKDEVNLEAESNIIEYESNTLDPKKETTPINKSPISKSPISKSPISKSPVLRKSPVPIAITEIMQTSNHLTSGSVSDVVSGSSPEVDNVGTSETVSKKNVENITRESWAIFDTPHRNNSNNKQRGELAKEKQVQSEEGVSPWSSDSKEFGNGSPSEWQQPRDSGSEGEWNRQRRRERDGTWWDSQGEREGHYDKPSRIGYTRERRSTDSYDDEWYEPDRPPRRRTRQQASHNWNKTSIGSGERVIADRKGERDRDRERDRGQSSSSRDVSPWEEDEPRNRREREECWRECRRGRGPSWDRERHRRRDDSWDEEDDYEYEDEYISGKFHWPERPERPERHGHTGPREPPDHWDSGGDQWPEERRHVRRRAHPQEDRWTRPDWDHESDIVCGTKEKVRYNSSRWPNQEGKWRKRETDRYYKREHSQESPWEDDYSNDPDEPQSPRYLTSRRNWKRPSSASEMDRKTGEIKARGVPPYYMGTGGSDGERDRKYRASRRSRSRDSQFTEMTPHQRHKPDTSLTLGRYSHRNRDKLYSGDFSPQDAKPDPNPIKKSATLGRKKIKELPSPKIENDPTCTINKTRKQHLMFENDFVNSETEPVTKFTFENEFETSEAPVVRYAKEPEYETKRNIVINKQPSFANDFSKDATKQEQIKQQKSLFEDDFSPTEKPTSEDNNGITVIAEETVSETRVSFTENNLDKVTTTATETSKRQTKNILSKSRNNRGDVHHIKKSESVNIFARENDPFDDDFFSGRSDEVIMQKVDNTTKLSPNNVAEFKWTEDFDSFDIPEEK